MQDDAGEQQQGRGRDDEPERGRQPGAQRAAGEAGGLRLAGRDGAQVQGGGPLGGTGTGWVADPPGVNRERQVAGDGACAGQRVQVGQDGDGTGGGRYGRHDLGDDDRDGRDADRDAEPAAALGTDLAGKAGGDGDGHRAGVREGGGDEGSGGILGAAEVDGRGHP
ncbi:hypothetical protein ACQP08_08725 [Micromonospora zamorensis]|uniref:hypothetical protein n=1 Tax=Micromonospora zamorensis TaxID=709883 RepID=UPI003D94BD0B